MGMMSRMATIVKSKMNRVLDNAEDPREIPDYSYEKQLELLRNVKRAVVEMATAKRRLDLQASGVKRRLELLVSRIQTELAELDQQSADMEIEQEKLTNAEKRLQAKVQAFRTKKEVIKAQYNADQTPTR